jgi:hypothetical protein
MLIYFIVSCTRLITFPNLLNDHHLNATSELEIDSIANDRKAPILLNAFLDFFTSSIGKEAADGRIKTDVEDCTNGSLTLTESEILMR